MVKQGKKIPGTPGLDPTHLDRGVVSSNEVKMTTKVIPAANNKERIIQQLAEKTLNGVGVCKDGAVLDDPALSFSWFKERYPGSAAIEENKSLLKAKYAEAKKTGEKVNKARSTINYLKTTIEQLRRERAMERVVEDREEKLVAEEGKSTQGTDDFDPEEAEHRKSIEQVSGSSVDQRRSFEQVRI